MRILRRKILIAFLVCLILIVGIGGRVWAQTASTSATPSPEDSAKANDLLNTIHDLESKIAEAQGQEKTLSAQITTMDNNVKLTQLRIESTKQQIIEVTSDISTASKKITLLESSLNNLTKVLLSRIVATYEVGNAQPLEIFASSNSIGDYFTRANYLRIAQAHDKELVYDTVQAKNDYANQKAIFEDKKQKIQSLQDQLISYTKQLEAEKVQKQNLLTQTQGSEATYQKLLAQAQAQLAGFRNFVKVQGGASILTGQTDCGNSWGCYYNQRDSQWGTVGINGTNTSIAEAGCLMTSMAMVLSHYGHSVTPLDINVGSNFFSSTAYLLFTTYAGGVTARREGQGASTAAIDAVLNDSSHDPVIVGISYDGGPIPDHFVVLVSGSGGDYVMNDPFVANGNHISFGSKYSVASIKEVDKVVMQ